MPMDIAPLVARDAVFANVDAHSKKHAIQEVSAAAARLTKLPERAIFDTLLQRERLAVVFEHLAKLLERDEAEIAAGNAISDAALAPGYG